MRVSTITTLTGSLVFASVLVLAPVSPAKAGSDVLKGAVIGAGVGSLVGGSDGAKKGALIGAIAGA